MQCPTCGEANPDHARFCLSCGASLLLSCPSCGQELPPTARFCFGCGTALTAPVAADAPGAPAPPQPALPTSFASGRYQVKRFLGEGGKKRVYLVHDTLLDRDVAFSLIKTDGLDEVGVERIRREARVMGRLGDHPHIVSLYDIGEEQGQPFLVSQLMRGGDVEGLIAQAPEHRVPLAQVLRLADQVCQALEYAHEHGIIHRDLKPGNVWLTTDGTAKLGDFGLAMAIDKTRLSIAGMIVGTVGYMPPEQALGRLPDARSDLYSLGAMLYELVTGRPPFLGDDPVAIISQHVNTQPVAPSWYNPGTPRPLEALILSLLAKDPSERPASAAVVRVRLAEIAAMAGAPTAGASDSATPAANPLDRLAGGVFVGRERELADLRLALDRALSGRGQIVLVMGEPGIGKTRLTEELSTYAALRGVQTLWGHNFEWEGAPAYWPWVQLLRSYVHERDPETLRADLGEGAADIAQVVSEIRQRLPGLPELPPMEPEQARFRLFDGIAAFLKNASRRQPLLLVLDDLHWADKPTLLLLEFLAHELGTMRVLLVGTYRDVEVSRRHPLSATLAELARQRSETRILLRGLTHDNIARYIALTAGSEPPETLVDVVFRETEGNPFFVAEVVRLLVSEGKLGRAAGTTSWSVSVPESVRDVIGRRLSRLSEETNAALAIASVIGREFNLQVLERMTDLTGDELLDQLEEAVRARLIEEQATMGRYRFSHALVQETLYEELSTGRRVRLHGRIGQALEQVHAGGLDAHLADLAYHYVEAAPGGHVDKAIEYSIRAAERAIRQLAWEDAVEHYKRALQAVEQQEVPDSVQHCEILLALGSVHDLAEINMLSMEPRQPFRRAAEIARKAGLSEHLARAALGFGGRDMSITVGGMEQLRLGEEGLAALGAGDSTLRAKLLARYASDVRWMLPGEFARFTRLSDEALAMARRLDDAATLAFVLGSRVIASKHPDDIEEIVSEVEELLSVAESVGESFMLGAGYILGTNYYWTLGDLRDGDRLVDALSDLRERSRLPIAPWWEGLLRAERARMTGEFADAEILRERFFVLLPEFDWEYVPQLVLLRREQGRLREIPDDILAHYRHGIIDDEVVRRHVGVLQYAHTLLAWLDLELGRVEDARAVFEELAQEGFAGVLPEYWEWLGTIAMLSEMCVEFRDKDRADRLYTLLLPNGKRNLTGGVSFVSHGAGDHYLGLLATLLERWDDAARHFEDGLAMNTRMEMWPYAAHTQYAYADMLVQRDQPGDREQAWALVDEALSAAKEMGMVRLAGQALALKVQLQGILKA